MLNKSHLEKDAESAFFERAPDQYVGVECRPLPGPGRFCDVVTGRTMELDYASEAELDEALSRMRQHAITQGIDMTDCFEDR